MKEKVLTNKKNGMLVLLLTIILYVVAASGVLVWAISPPLYLLCVAYLCLGWLVAPGLKVLGPQEALVLTLFGKYIGTLKGAGFYFVNPFCSAVNPAAHTVLGQIHHHSLNPCVELHQFAIDCLVQSVNCSDPIAHL